VRISHGSHEPLSVLSKFTLAILVWTFPSDWRGVWVGGDYA
jgi:hypothetical protein